MQPYAVYRPAYLFGVRIFVERFAACLTHVPHVSVNLFDGSVRQNQNFKFTELCGTL
jgi:hypothetical protein